MIPRRTALLAGLLLPTPALAQPHRATPHAPPPHPPAPAAPAARRAEARLRAGAPPIGFELTGASIGRDRVQRLRASGAVGGEIILPSRSGGTGSARVLPMHDREVILVNLAGLVGTGVAQQLGALVGADDQGRLRIIGLENLDARENSSCQSEGRLTGRLEPGEDGTLLLACAFQRVRGPCGQNWTGAMPRLAWTDTLTWDGRGAVQGEPAPDDASRLRHAVANARAKVAAMLTPVVTDLRGVDWEATGVSEIVLLGLA